MQTIRADDAPASVIRSFLFVPGDSGRKLRKAAECAADALIVDLEDSVAPQEKARARSISREFLDEYRDMSGHGNGRMWVRINPLDTEDALADLRAVMPASPAGIVLPKPRGSRDTKQLASLLDAFEQEHDLPLGGTSILPIATERPGALFDMHGYAGLTARLAGVTWGAEDLSAALGASQSRDGNGNWLPPYELARSLCLLAAASAEVPAVDTVFTDYRDDAGLRARAAAARRDGFSGMLAIHPDQAAAINEAFVPSREETERARRIVALFEANPDAGTLGLDGEMLDRPHLVQARRILAMAERLKSA